MKKKILYILILVLLIGSVIFLLTFLNKEEQTQPTKKDNQVTEKENNETEKNEVAYQVNINVNGVEYQAILEANPTTKELLNRLPLELTMKELNKNEKYAYLEEALPTNQAQVAKINSGDIMLYQDNCLVLFYDTFNTSYSYTRIGAITHPDSLKEAVGLKDSKVIISRS